MRGAVLVAAAITLAAGCSGRDRTDANDLPGDRDPVDAPDYVLAVAEAIEAVEDELGEGQRFFEVTANAQFTNVFVATDDGTTAVPYLFVDGELQPPAPAQTGASGNTFGADDVRFDPSLILSGVSADLPDTSIDALSVYGDGVGAIYVLGATSQVGGQLDIVVAPNGAIVSVDPL
ncbi:MAG: hypothetical protein AAGG08_16300 [Actinomycetota bacterium]